MFVVKNIKGKRMETVVDDGLHKVQITDGVVFETREQIPEIEEYLENILDQLQPLKYIYEDGFDAEATFKILDQDLPTSSIEGQKEYFINDIIRLCTLFSCLKKNTTMKVQIEIVKTNKCRLFHNDFYRQRLLCTYLGPGTEWLDHSNVNREALGKGCNENIVKDFSKINKAKEFEVLLLKGAKYDENELSIVHRSPPIEQDQITRILLKIDE